jgi:hypothetical protein
MARQVYGQNFSLLRRTVWLLRRGQTDGRTDGQTDRIPDFNTSLIGRGKNRELNNIFNFNDVALSNYLVDVLIAQSSILSSILPEIESGLQFIGEYINELESFEG